MGKMRIKTEFCPACGKAEIIRYHDTALNYREACPVCGEDILVTSDPAKPITVHIVRSGTLSSVSESHKPDLDALEDFSKMMEGLSAH